MNAVRGTMGLTCGVRESTSGLSCGLSTTPRCQNPVTFVTLVRYFPWKIHVRMYMCVHARVDENGLGGKQGHEGHKAHETADILPSRPGEKFC